MYRKHPHITRELIKEYHEDVICLSACISGEVPQLLGKDYDQKALEAAQWYQSVFGKDYYIEIQHHNIPIEKVINPKLEQLAKRIGSKLVATLIVQDFINFAKNNNIPVGLGRGSAAGSLVACAMNITDIDPIKYGLLFERFLNEDRVSYPDIDSDFSLKDRQKVLEYVKNKYGSNCVSKIIDITRLMPRNAVRDVARVMGYPYSVGYKISKAIPDSAKTLKSAMDTSPELQELYKQPEVKQIFDTACKIEGLPRGVSVHACGVLIAPSDVSDFMPQVVATDRETGEKVWVTQYSGPSFIPPGTDG